MTTSTYVSNDLLRSYGIEEVGVEIEVERVSKESYHRAGAVRVDDIIEVDDTSSRRPNQRLKDAAQSQGYAPDELGLFLYETFDDKIEEVAMEDGPGLEADAYSAY